MKVGNEIDHLGLSEMEYDYNKGRVKWWEAVMFFFLFAGCAFVFLWLMPIALTPPVISTIGV